MLVTASVPDESVGDVMGDLSSRRGRPLGTEAVGGMTEVKAEVPMAEMLSYAPDLRSITGGQGEYTLEFLRYEEVPAHLAQKVVADGPEGAGGGLRVAPQSRLRPGLGALLPLPGRRWPEPRTSAPTRRTSPATSAGARCCAASTPRASWPAASAGRCASCAPPARSTRAGSASPGGDDLELRHRSHDGRGRSFLDRLRARRERAREVGDAIAAEERRAAEWTEPPRDAPRARARARARDARRGAAAPAPRARGPDQRRPQDGSARWRSSTPPTTRAPWAAWPARSAPPRCACARSASAPASSRSPSCGSSAGTATRSTSPTRRAASGATRRATSCTELSRRRAGGQRGRRRARRPASRLTPAPTRRMVDPLRAGSLASIRAGDLLRRAQNRSRTSSTTAREVLRGRPERDGHRRPAQAGAARRRHRRRHARGARPPPPPRGRRLPAARLHQS